MAVPAAEALLPELIQFTRRLADECSNGRITGWGGFTEQVHSFYTPDMMGKIEHVLQGWSRMASYANQQTLIHVTSVLTALYLLPEYQQAASEQKLLMEWMVLLHDIAKEAHPGKHDYIHAFRSAAIAGRVLTQVGFEATDAYAALIDGWFALTHTAIIYHPEHAENIQDNRKLPEILSGIDQLFGTDAPAGLVIKAILLHLSILTDPDYPTVAPLSRAEIQKYVDPSLFPMLKAMMLVDNDAWNLFDPKQKAYYRQQTLAVFNEIAAQP